MTQAATRQCAALNARFAIPGVAQFSVGPGGMAQLALTPTGVRATIALQGAHLTDWQPTGQPPVIWLSDQARFAAGQSLRGGVPICWPWFGAHATDPSLAAHGFARSVPWRVSALAVEGGEVTVEFELVWDEANRAQWPQPTALSYRITVGERLRLALTTRNLGAEAFTIGQALHSYFVVGAIETVTVDGLDGVDYLDKVAGFARHRQQGPIRFTSEVDRIYLGSEGDCLINDPTLGRRIRIRKQGSASTVVWNPWAEVATRMGDLGPEGYRRMVCVESANAAEDRVVIAAGGHHTLAVEYRVEPLP